MIRDIETLLTEDEVVLQDCRVHWIVFCKPLVYAVLALLVAALFHPLVGALILLMDMFAFFAAVVFYETTHLVLTQKKVIGRTGFLTRDWSQLSLSHIETAYLQEPIMGRWIGYSSVVVRGTGIGIVAFPYLVGGEEFLMKLEEYLALEDSRRQDNVINIMIPAAATEFSIERKVKAIG